MIRRAFSLLLLLTLAGCAADAPLAPTAYVPRTGDPRILDADGLIYRPHPRAYHVRPSHHRVLRRLD